MLIIFVAALIISVTICLILVLMRNKDRCRTNSESLDRFRKIAIENDLSISGQEILERTVIGLDGIQKKLLILTKTGINKYDSLIIELSQVNRCFKRKTFKYLNRGSPKRMRHEKYVEKIVLEFEFIDDRQPVQLTFFDSINDYFLTKSKLDQKARNWETILSKLLKRGLRKIS